MATANEPNPVLAGREARYATLTEELEVLNEDFAAVLSGHDRLIIKRKIKVVEEELNRLSAEMTESRRSHSRSWDERLPEIDFKKAMEAVDVVRLRLEPSGAALFLLQDAHSRAAALCLQRMLAALKMPGGHVHEMNVTFTFLPPSPDRLLQVVASYLGIGKNSPAGDTEAFATKVLDTLRGTLGGGGTIWVEMKVDKPEGVPAFCDWFLERFWRPLIQLIETQQTVTRKPARVIGVLVVKTPFHGHPLRVEATCGLDEFVPHRFLELPLQPRWESAEIRDWLQTHTDAETRLGAHRFDEMIRYVLDDDSQGVPCDVLGRLQDLLSEMARGMI